MKINGGQQRTGTLEVELVNWPECSAGCRHNEKEKYKNKMIMTMMMMMMQ